MRHHGCGWAERSTRADHCNCTGFPWDSESTISWHRSRIRHDSLEIHHHISDICSVTFRTITQPSRTHTSLYYTNHLPVLHSLLVLSRSPRLMSGTFRSASDSIANMSAIGLQIWLIDWLITCKTTERWATTPAVPRMGTQRSQRLAKNT